MRRTAHDRLFNACLAGDLPAEELPTDLRQQLVSHLHGLGWTDLEIAVHCRMSTYTTGRIRSRLDLAPNFHEQGAA